MKFVTLLVAGVAVLASACSAGEPVVGMTPTERAEARSLSEDHDVTFTEVGGDQWFGSLAIEIGGANPMYFTRLQMGGWNGSLSQERASITGTISFDESAFLFQQAGATIEIRPQHPWDWIYADSSGIAIGGVQDLYKVRGMSLRMDDDLLFVADIDAVRMSDLDLEAHVVPDTAVMQLRVSGLANVHCLTETSDGHLQEDLMGTTNALCRTLMGID